MAHFDTSPNTTLCATMAKEQDFTNYSPIIQRDAPCRPQHRSVETLYTMMAQDADYSCCRDYLCNDSSCSIDVPKEISGRRITADDRTKIVDWCYSLIDLCRLSRESVGMAMDIVDRFMSNPSRPLTNVGKRVSPSFSHQEILHNRNIYQLVAVSALYIAIKINERVIFSSDELSAVCRGMYTRESIEAMERTILHCLSWRVSAPTPLQVGSVVFELMIAEVQEANSSVMDAEWLESIQEEFTYQTEIAVRDYQLAIQRPSTLAFMALLNAIEFHRKVDCCDQEELLLKALGSILRRVKSMTSDV